METNQDYFNQKKGQDQSQDHDKGNKHQFNKVLVMTHGHMEKG
jgi:hypothetical protein